VLSITGVLRKSKINSRFVVDLSGKKFLCDVFEKENMFNVEYGTGYQSLTADWKLGDRIFRGVINDREINVKILSNNYAGDYIMQYMGNIFNVTVRNPRISELEQFMLPKELEKKPQYLKSPIFGKLTMIKVKEGDEVIAGTEICCIEGMKMENIIRTDFDAKIKKIHKNAKELVGKEDIVIEYEYNFIN
jgi:propionyl-CoA carboxylase alpha chain